MKIKEQIAAYRYEDTTKCHQSKTTPCWELLKDEAKKPWLQDAEQIANILKDWLESYDCWNKSAHLLKADLLDQIR